MDSAVVDWQATPDPRQDQMSTHVSNGQAKARRVIEGTARLVTALSRLGGALSVKEQARLATGPDGHVGRSDLQAAERYGPRERRRRLWMQARISSMSL